MPNLSIFRSKIAVLPGAIGLFLFVLFVCSAPAFAAPCDANGLLTETRPEALTLHAPVPVLILGGGPAGLSLAFELKARGIESLILERNAQVGSSWRNMPAKLSLLSPWESNVLAGPKITDHKASAQLTRAQYAEYLENYQRLHQLAVHPETAVEALEKQSDGSWLVRTSKGIFPAGVVVNATGYFSNPFVPEFAGAATTRIPQLHFSQYKGPETVRQQLRRSSGRVLIVGKRLSAGQVMRELADSGFDVALSFRGKLEFMPVGPESGALGKAIIFKLVPRFEDVALALGVKFPQPTMEGGRTKELVKSGQVRLFGNIARFDGDKVVFEQGGAEKFDLVIYTTGFRPALAHLKDTVTLDERTGAPELNGNESTEAPGLYFVGIDRQGTEVSRFLRGIRQDAARLADQLAAGAR